MNILIIGLGSVGQRHLRNIKKIIPNSRIFAFRRKFSSPTLSNNNNVQKISLQKKFNINYLKSLKNLKKYKIDSAIICSPSSFHIKEAIILLKQKISVFIEKPLGTNLKNINVLKKIADNTNQTSMVGFQLKFCPIINYLKKIISQEKFGKINFVSIHHGEHIKNFHKYENYKNLYASKKKLGGGVVLTQIHEIDYMLFILEGFEIKRIVSDTQKVSNLDIDVEDISSSVLRFENKKKEKIICNLHINYLEIPRKRKIEILFEKAKVVADLVKQEIIIFKGEKSQISKKFKYARNELFIKEIQYFLKSVRNKKKVNKIYGIDDAIKSLKLAIKIKN
jgi:predicted dehydrogenase